jgi:predicted RNA-binding Zn-ribbon protein involved in translation (DUF1610 family)
MSYNQEPIPRYTAADKRLSKIVYDIKKYDKDTNTSKFKKLPDVSKFSTLQEAYDHAIKSFEKQKKKCKTTQDLERIEQEEAEYLLNTMPFIKEYGVDVKNDQDDQNAVITVKHTNSNRNTFNKYLYSVEKVFNTDTLRAVMDVQTNDALSECACGGKLEVHGGEALLVCPKCGKTQVYVESHNMGEHSDGMAYKRINHLTECLNALQGKEGTTVPQEVIEQVRAEFKKNRISSTADIKPSKVKQYLKKLGYSAYYENIHTIANAITGQPTLKLSLELEKKFKDMFHAIQEPFYRHKPPKRKNFLSYNYVLYKFSELLGEDDLLVHFPLLKCSKNLHSQDVVWSKICSELSWEFIATV